MLDRRTPIPRTSDARRRRRPSTSGPTTTPASAYGTDALKRGQPADVVVLPGTTAEVAAVVRALRRAPHADRAARRRHRLHRRLGAHPRRRRPLAGADEPHPRDRRSQPARRRRAERHHRRPAGRRRAGRAVLSARPGVAAAVGHRRQRRRVRRRAARLQVRHDQAVRARPRGRAADRRDHRDRRQGRQERRRLRPDAPARRLRGHAGDHHEDHPAARPQAADAGDAPRDVPRASRPRSPAVSDIIRARVVPAALELDRRRLARGRGADTCRCARSRRRAPRRCC